MGVKTKCELRIENSYCKRFSHGLSLAPRQQKPLSYTVSPECSNQDHYVM